MEYQLKIVNYHENTNLYLLAGRGMNPKVMIESFGQCFQNWNISTIEPDIEWYPAPNGINNQYDAVVGVKEAGQLVASLIKENSNFPLNRVGIAGFSAGAVVALEASFILKELGFVISCSGAILDTMSLDLNEIRKIKTAYHIIHGRQDTIFSWNERYLPVKKTLENNNSYFYELDLDHRISSDVLYKISALEDLKISII